MQKCTVFFCVCLSFPFSHRHRCRRCQFAILAFVCASNLNDCVFKKSSALKLNQRIKTTATRCHCNVITPPMFNCTQRVPPVDATQKKAGLERYKNVLKLFGAVMYAHFACFTALFAKYVNHKAMNVKKVVNS